MHTSNSICIQICICIHICIFYIIFIFTVGGLGGPRAKMPFSCLHASNGPSFMPTAHHRANALGYQGFFVWSTSDSHCITLLHFPPSITLCFADGTSQYCRTSFRFPRRCCFHCIFIKSAPHRQCTALTGENAFYNKNLDFYLGLVGAAAKGNPAAWTSSVLGKWIKPFDAAFHTAPQKNVKVVSNESETWWHVHCAGMYESI